MNPKHKHHYYRRKKQQSPMNGLLAGVFVLALLPPVAIGGVHRTTVAAICAVACAIVWVLSWRARYGVVVRIPTYGLILLGATTYTVMQVVPLPIDWLKVIAPSTFETLEVSLAAVGGLSAWYPVSLDQTATFWEIIKVGSCALAFIISHNVLIDRYQRDLMLTAFVIVGIVITLTGLVGSVIEPSKFLFFYTPDASWATELIHTSFVNPNHAAAFLSMCTMLALGLALARRDLRVRAVFLVAAALLGTGVFLTLSRGGIVTLSVALIVFGAIQLLQFRKENSWRVLLVLGVLIAVLMLAGWLGFERILSEYRHTMAEGLQTSKLGIWSSGLSMVWDNPWVGVGRGAFMTAFPRYIKQGTSLSQTYSHMENQYLHLPVEWGLPVGLLIILVSVAALFFWWARGRKDPQTTAIVVALAALASHNVVDFSLEILGLAIPAAVLMGILSSGSHQEVQLQREAKGGGASNNSNGQQQNNHTAYAIALAGIGVLLIALCVWVVVTTVGHGYKENNLVRATAMVGKPEKLEEALALVKSSIRKRPADYLPHLIGGQLTLRAGKAEALAWLNRAMYLYPANPDIHVETARALRIIGRRYQALLEYRIALRNSSFNTVVLHEALPLCKTLEEIEHFIREFPQEYTQVIDYLYVVKRYELAVQLAQRALSHWPTDKNIVAVAVNVFVALGQMEKATDAARRLIEAEPSAAAYLTLAHATAPNNPERQIPILVQARNRFTNDRSIGYALAKAYLESKQPTNAEKIAKELMDQSYTFTTRAECHDLLAKIYDAQGKVHQADWERDAAKRIREGSD